MSEGARWKASRCLRPAPAAETGRGQPRPGHFDFASTRAVHGGNDGMGKVRAVMLNQISYMDTAWLFQLLF